MTDIYPVVNIFLDTPAESPRQREHCRAAFDAIGVDGVTRGMRFYAERGDQQHTGFGYCFLAYVYGAPAALVQPGQSPFDVFRVAYPTISFADFFCLSGVHHLRPARVREWATEWLAEQAAIAAVIAETTESTTESANSALEPAECI